jgi:hypothetical protein
MKHFFFKNAIWFIIAISIVSRLPQLVNISYVLDQDECIIGIMAKHFAENKGIPLFFYGQSYGFSFIEVLFVRLAFLGFGINETAVHIGMLILWTLGICFHYKTLKNLVRTNPENDSYQDYLPLVLTLFFILCPAWAVWSMKARGGYLTAFTLFSVVTYLASHRTRFQNWYAQLVIGILIILIFEAQPLFLAGLLPLLAFFIYPKISIARVAAIGLGIVSTIILFYFLKKGLYSFWVTKPFSLSLFHVDGIFKNLYENLTGSHSYGYTTPKTPTLVLTQILVFALIASLVFGLFRFLKKQALQPLFYVSAFAILGTISYQAFFDENSPRYLLPLYGCMSLLFFTFLQDMQPIYIQYSKLFKATGISVLLLGAVSMYNFRFMYYERIAKPTLSNFIYDIERQGNRFVFCNNGGLQWQLMFYSQERIIARGTSLGRYPPYTNIVNDAVYMQSNTTAIVDYLASSRPPEIESELYKTADKQFFIYKTMNKALLVKAGFGF